MDLYDEIDVWVGYNKKVKAAESGDTKKGKSDEEELDPTKYFENRKAWFEKK